MRLALIGAACALLVSGCATKPLTPPQAPPAVEVLIPVPVPCEVAQVAPSELPTASGVPHDIYEAVKRVLADRAVLMADRTKMRAANTDPCPKGTK